MWNLPCTALEKARRLEEGMRRTKAPAAKLLRARVQDKDLGRLIATLKGRSSGRSSVDSYPFHGNEIRELIAVCEDLRDARALLDKTSWLRAARKAQR